MLILLALIQALFLCIGQVLLKIGMQALPPFTMSWTYAGKVLTDWWLLGCGISFIVACLLWMYMLRHYPFSHVYPLSSVAYVFGMIAAMTVFNG